MIPWYLYAIAYPYICIERLLEFLTYRCKLYRLAGLLFKWRDMREHFPRPTLRCYANFKCPRCHGEGVVYEAHPYGSTVAREAITCECFADMITPAQLLFVDHDLVELDVRTHPERESQFDRLFHGAR